MYSTAPTGYNATCAGDFDTYWHHIAATYDSDTNEMKLYVDGDLCGTATFSGTHRTGTGLLGIGGIPTTGFGEDYYQNARHDEMRFSNIVRTAEEIKQNSQKRAFGVFISDVLDLGGSVSSYNFINWTENGVATGDGETLFDDTDLVAQWNFNETSGTTADNSGNATTCGGTPSNCDGTLTSCADTSGQDAAVGSGWTSNNRLWGAGALMLDGTNDYVSIGNSANPSSDFTLETWFYMSSFPGSGYAYISGLLGDVDSATANDYSMDLTINGNPSSGARYYLSSVFNSSANSNNRVYGRTELKTGQWYHAAATYNSTDNVVKVFLNGVEDGSLATSGTKKATGNNVLIGQNYGGRRLDGIIDSSRIYSRALSQDELHSNYQAGNVQVQTRTSADGTTWEEWKPVSGETQIDDFDQGYQYATGTTNLVYYWPLDETVENTCTGGEDACDVTSTNDGVSTATTIVDGVFGKSRTFDGSTTWIEVADDNSLERLTNGTFSYWIKPNYSGTPSQPMGMFSKANSHVTVSTYGAYHYTDGNLWIHLNNTAAINMGAWSPNRDEWYHLAFTFDGTDVKSYVNGHQNASVNNVSPSGSSNLPFYLGAYVYNTSSKQIMDGQLDEFRLYNTDLSATQIYEIYKEGTTNPGTLKGSTAPIEIEGTGALELQAGISQVDSNTVAMWHFDETNGDIAGYDVFDSSPNGNHIEYYTTPTLDTGIAGNARNFDASSSHALALTSSSLELSNQGTIELWINPDTLSQENFAGLVCKDDGGGSRRC